MPRKVAGRNQRSKHSVSAVFIWVLIALAACSGSSASSTGSGSSKIEVPDGTSDGDKPDRSGLVKYEFPIEVTAEKLSSRQKALADKLQKNESISFSEITDLFIEKHVLAYNRENSNEPLDLAEFSTELMSLAKKVQDRSDLAKMKIEAEAALGGAIVYNKKYNTIPDVVRRRKLQCYSGTSFYQVMIRSHLGPQEFRNAHVVVILEKGHISSGYVRKDDKSGEWMLTAIESTASGRGEKRMGPLSKLDRFGAGTFRIMDAELWMIAEIFVDALQDPGKTADLLLELTNEKFDRQIPISALEANIAALPENERQSSTAQGGSVINAFSAFGTVNVPEGDIVRKSLDTMDRREQHPAQSARGLMPARQSSVSMNPLWFLNVLEQCGIKSFLETELKDETLCPADLLVGIERIGNRDYSLELRVLAGTQGSNAIERREERSEAMQKRIDDRLNTERDCLEAEAKVSSLKILDREEASKFLKENRRLKSWGGCR